MTDNTIVKIKRMTDNTIVKIKRMTIQCQNKKSKFLE